MTKLYKVVAVDMGVGTVAVCEGYEPATVESAYCSAVGLCRANGASRTMAEETEDGYLIWGLNRDREIINGFAVVR